MTYKVSEDGITHINCYSKGLTELGRLLTNFAHTPFEHTKYGHFESVEGLWYFLKTGRLYDKFRTLHGHQAKKVGQKLVPKVDAQDKIEIPQEFKEDILEGIRCKLRQNKDILAMMVDTDLPFAHYYYYGDPTQNPPIKTLPEYNWIMDELERIRTVTIEHLQNKKRKP